MYPFQENDMAEISNLSAYLASFFTGDIDSPVFWWNKLTPEEQAQVEPPYVFENPKKITEEENETK